MMKTWWTIPLIAIIGASFFLTGCKGSSSSNPNIPDYTVLSLPEPVEHGKNLVWSTSPGGFIIFDDALASTTSVSFTMQGTLDGDDEDIRVNLLDSENPGSNGIEVRIGRTTTGGAPVANSLDLRLDEVATGAPCPTQTVVDPAYATGSPFSITIKVDQSGATPVAQVWLKGDPTVDPATYASTAADCAATSATWVDSIETRVAMGADSISLNSVQF